MGGWSRTSRIKTLLAIDSLFFFIEIIVGYAVGSLALVADSFHMLNDVCSLVVALYAIKFAENRQTSDNYSYGWQRAEVLGALINGVFLLALCFSIFMEAIERFFNATEVTSPRLVVVVGAFGLASNIIGLFLFHDHGHSHGGHSHGHSHAHGSADAAAEAGSLHGSPKKPKKRGSLPLPNGKSGALPVVSESSERAPLLSSSAPPNGSRTPSWDGQSSGDESDGEDVRDPLDDIFVHPAQARDNVIRAAEMAGYGATQSGGSQSYSSGKPGHHRNSSSSSVPAAEGVEGRSRSRSAHTAFGAAIGRRSSASGRGRRDSAPPIAGAPATVHEELEDEHVHGADGHHEGGHRHSHDEEEENGHDKGKAHDHGHHHSRHSHGHGHGHEGGSMNMRGVFLHVLGDALGNVGVIAAGLIIWLTTWSGRFYFDPLISLVITVIIFSSALPLVKSASFILLQGTPQHLSLRRVRKSILAVPGVMSVHELHIWSLSESKLVASVHVCVAHQDEYAEISHNVRKELHRFGVHSSTIQPEFIGDPSAVPDLREAPSFHAVAAPEDAEALGCLVRCDVNCGEESCCPPKPAPGPGEGAIDIVTDGPRNGSGESRSG